MCCVDPKAPIALKKKLSKRLGLVGRRVVEKKQPHVSLVLRLLARIHGANDPGAWAPGSPRAGVCSAHELFPFPSAFSNHTIFYDRGLFADAPAQPALRSAKREIAGHACTGLWTSGLVCGGTG